MRALAIQLTLLIVAFPTIAAETVPGPVPASYVDAYDGDTFTVRCTIWPGHIVETRVRPAGVDTPEIRGQCPREKHLARRAREATHRLLSQARRIALHDVRQGKYAGRVIARVRVDGAWLSELLIESGLGRPYDGGTRGGWCE